MQIFRTTTYDLADDFDGSEGELYQAKHAESVVVSVDPDVPAVLGDTIRRAYSRINSESAALSLAQSGSGSRPALVEIDGRRWMSSTGNKGLATTLPVLPPAPPMTLVIGFRDESRETISRILAQASATDLSAGDGSHVVLSAGYTSTFALGAVPGLGVPRIGIQTGGGGTGGRVVNFRYSTGRGHVLAIRYASPGGLAEMWLDGILYGTAVAPSAMEHAGQILRLLRDVRSNADERGACAVSTLYVIDKALNDVALGRAMRQIAEDSAVLGHGLPSDADIATITGHPVRSLFAVDARDPSGAGVLAKWRSGWTVNAASTAKVMTNLLIERAVNDGLVGWDDPVTHTAVEDAVTGSGNILEVGDIVSLRDLVYCSMLPSSNEATLGAAHHVGRAMAIAAGNPTPTYAQAMVPFYAAMNAAAAELGMTDTVYDSVHGGPAGAHTGSASASATGQRTTAEDLGRLCAHVWRNRQARYPVLWAAGGTASAQVSVAGPNARTLTLNNTNRFLTGASGVTIDQNVGWGKTGQLIDWGGNLVVIADINGVPVVFVVAGVEQASGNSSLQINARFPIMRELMDRVRARTDLRAGRPLIAA